MLLGEFSAEDDEIEIPEELQDRRKYRVGRQYAINQLINTKEEPYWPYVTQCDLFI